jgi:hypothetical protein
MSIAHVGLAGEPSLAATTTQTTRQQIEATIRGVRARPGISCKLSEAQDEVMCSASAETTIWVFTTTGHPGHPALVERTMVVQPDGLSIARHGKYAGSRPEFDRWYRQFEALDRRQIADWQAILQGRPNR